MSSQAMYRLGRYAAVRPWRVIGLWLIVSVLVVGASAMFGQKLEDSFGAPGLESQTATDLLTEAGADQAGLTAQVVATPRSAGATFPDSPLASSGLGRPQIGGAGAAPCARDDARLSHPMVAWP